MKKKMALLLCLALIFAMIPTMTYAGTDTGNKLYWCESLAGVGVERVGTSDEYKLVNTDEAKAPLTESDLSAWNNGQIDKRVGDADMNIYIAYVKEGKAYTSSAIVSPNTGTAKLDWNEAGYYTVSFVGAGGVGILVNNDSSYGELIIDVREGNQGGNDNNPSGEDDGIVILDSNYKKIIDNNVIYEELQCDVDGERKFYIVFNEEGSYGVSDIEIIDHYKTMHASNEGGTRPDVAVSEDAIKFETVASSTEADSVFNQAAAGAGYSGNEDNLHIFAASVNSKELRNFSYRKSGIVCGSLKVRNGDNDPIETEIAVCADGFASDFTVNDKLADGDNVLKFIESQNSTSAIKEKTVKMFEEPNSETNKIYLSVANGSTKPNLSVYAMYKGAYGNPFYEKVDSSCVTMSENGTPYTITLNKFYGHNDLVLVAEADGVKKALTVYKAIKYEFDKDAFAVADDISDYMKVLWGSSDNKRLETETVTNDGKTTVIKTDSNVGGKKSGNMPYNGGYFGTVIKLNKNYRLKGIEATRSGKEDDKKINLDYLIVQSIFYEVSGTPKDDIDDVNYNDFQIAMQSSDNTKYLVQIDIGLAEFNYYDDAYHMSVYSSLLDAVNGYSNFIDWMQNAFKGKCNIEYKNSCLYYDIFCGGDAGNDDETLQTLYTELDKIGTIKFLTEKDSAEDFADVGIKPADDVSTGCWSEDSLDEFGSGKCDDKTVKYHEDVIEGFNGNEDEKVLDAYGFDIKTANEDDTFEGMLDVYIPVPKNVENPEDCKVYWMAPNENDGDDPYPIPMPARYVEKENDDRCGYMAFTTSHFSDYVLVTDTDNVKENSGDTNKPSGSTGSTGSSGGGGAAAVTPDVTTDTSANTTTSKTDAEMAEQAQAGAAKAAMKARSSKTAKGNIKVVFRPDEETENFIKEMKALGYTVKYRYYRSTKKSSAYKAMLTKSGRTYINTNGKSGTRYYYKVQVLVYDANGKLVAKTGLRQCKYACRQWSK